RHTQEPALVARLDARGIDTRGQRHLDAEQPLWDAGRVVHGVPAARGQMSASLDDQAVVEELDLEVVLIDTREVHRHLDRPGRLGDIRGRPPARLDQQAERLVLPRSAERPRLRGDAQRCGAIGHASITHDARMHCPRSRPIVNRCARSPSCSLYAARAYGTSRSSDCARRSRNASASKSAPNTIAYAPIHSTMASAPAAGATTISTPKPTERTPLIASHHSPVIWRRRRTAATTSSTPVTMAQAAMI